MPEANAAENVFQPVVNLSSTRREPDGKRDGNATEHIRNMTAAQANAIGVQPEGTEEEVNRKDTRKFAGIPHGDVRCACPHFPPEGPIVTTGRGRQRGENA
jgi:hypothetical protein